MRLSRIELLFICVALAMLAGILGSIVNAPQQVGADLGGTIQVCTRRAMRTNSPRLCTVRLDDGTLVTVYDQTHNTHDRVLVMQMRYRLSQRLYYTVIHGNAS